MIVDVLRLLLRFPVGVYSPPIERVGSPDALASKELSVPEAPGVSCFAPAIVAELPVPGSRRLGFLGTTTVRITYSSSIGNNAVTNASKMAINRTIVGSRLKYSPRPPHTPDIIASLLLR